MAERRAGGSFLPWIGGALLAAGAGVLFGYWIHAITSAGDLPLLLTAALIAMPAGLAVLLVSVLRDRIAARRRENFLEVDN